MLTIHRGTGVRVSDAPGCPVDCGHALVVSADRIAAVGPYGELYEEFGEGARVREWSGTIVPGRHEPDAAALLEHTYWPDPREAGELGTEPLTGDAVAALEMTDTRWGASARRGLQRLLASGTTSLSGELHRPSVRTAVQRSPLHHLPTARAHTLEPSAPADFAVFTDDGAGAAEGGTCLATVLGGRLLHRRR